MADKNIDRAILSQEVTSPYARIFRFVDYMPNPDELLRDRGETIELYKRMLLDARIYSLIELRKSIACDRGYTIVCDDKNIVDFLYGVLSSINIRKTLKDIMSTLEFGFSVSEIIWRIDGGTYIPNDIKLRDPERFSFDYNGNLYVIQDGIRKRCDEPYKFIIHRHEYIESPYGSSILKQCYWPWMFKNAGFRFWMITAEKFGVPTVIAIFESDDEEKARQRAKELAEALSGIQSDAAIALGNVKEINTLEIKGNIDSFKVLIDACDNQFSYAITGQNLASAEGKYGTRAQAEIHEKMLQSVAAKDAIDLGHTLTNQLIKYIVTLNFGTDAPGASIVFDTDEYAEWTVVKDAIQVGVPVSKRLLYTEYNIPEPDNDEDSFISPKASEATQVNMADIDSKKKLKRPYLRIS